MTPIGSLLRRARSRAFRHALRADALLPGLGKLSDADLRRSFIESSTKDPNSLAACAEAVRRQFGFVPHRGQLHAAAAMAGGGVVVQMATGEGKTVAACMAACLAARDGRVHVLTANDYLARRDAESMAPVVRRLGLSSGCVETASGLSDRREAYLRDVLWATATEVGFDHLRDGMRWTAEEIVQTGFRLAIVDEADSLLLDEAKTPLVLSSPGEAPEGLVARVRDAVARLLPREVRLDMKERSVSLTEAGGQRVERLLSSTGILDAGASLYDGSTPGHHVMTLVHQALRARFVWKCGVDYVVIGEEVVIVDRSTGRPMTGRRWPNGLHAAVEALEGVPVLPETRVAASMAHHALFRAYPLLSGMTGTLGRDGREVAAVYGLHTEIVPPHRPVARLDRADEVFPTRSSRDRSLVDRVVREVSLGRPVLIGVPDVIGAARLSGMLEAADVPHAVLDATRHRHEAAVIAQAGRPGAVTVATPMAGRGTDIVLGGNPDWMLDGMDPVLGTVHDLAAAVRRSAERAGSEVRAAGGLLVIGTVRHESRRVDDQLRGRSGRQGDPGESVFMLSPGDEPLGVHLGVKRARVRPHHFVRAQKKTEERDRHIRRLALERDAVPELQRRAARSMRARWLTEDAAVVQDTDIMLSRVVEDIAARVAPPGRDAELWDMALLEALVTEDLGPGLQSGMAMAPGAGAAELAAGLLDAVRTDLGLRWMGLDHRGVVQACRLALLGACDLAWSEHLACLDSLRDGIGLRAYGQRDPAHEWNREAAASFDEFERRLARMALRTLRTLALRPPEGVLSA